MSLKESYNLAELDLRHPKISFDGPAEPRIINATPESCLIKQLNSKPTKEKLPKKAMQKKIRAIFNPASKNQNSVETPEPLTPVGGSAAVPASEEKVSDMFAQLNRIKEEAMKVVTKEAELNEEKKKIAGELEALEKKIADQEREWTQYFDAVRKEMARLIST